MNKYIFLILLILNLSMAEIVVSGFVTNKNTGEALIGANVFISDIKEGATTDKNGPEN